MSNQINNLKDKIQDLISKVVEQNNKQKELLNFLFKKLEEVKELETLQNLREYEKGKYLRAYLFYQAIKRANYQVEHLKLTHLDNIDKYLEATSRDIEELENGKKATPKEPTDQQLLTLLSERLALGKICLKKDGRYLFEVGKVGQPIPFKVFLEDGKIEPDPAEEFLKKHGLINEKKTKK